MACLDCEQFLTYLEQEARKENVKDAYLWPRTPMSNIQAEIWARTGASDWNDFRGRATDIIVTLQALIENNLLRRDFTYLDICTGDALVPWRVQRLFPFSRCFGVDLVEQETHELVTRHGVRLFRIPIQTLFRKHDVERFDVVSMLNTYRGWKSADLREADQWLPWGADEWFRQHARYVIVTTHDKQKQIGAGFWVHEIGPGEDDSRMVIMWPSGADDWNQ